MLLEQILVSEFLGLKSIHNLPSQKNIYLYEKYQNYHPVHLIYLDFAYSISQGVVQLNLDTNFCCTFASL